MELAEILHQQADYTTGSGYHVRFSSIFSWVSIEPINTDQNSDDEDGVVFMQGDDAEDFLTEVEELFEDVDCMTYETCMNANAAQYIDCLH